jgi:hypothetical protein
MYVSRARASMHRSVTDESALLTGERNECVGTHAWRCCLFVFLLCVCLGASLHVCAYLHVFVCLCVPVALSVSMFAVRVTRLSQTVPCVGMQWRLSSIPAIIFCLRCACGCLCISACVCLLCVFARASVGVFRVLHTHLCSCGVHQDRAMGNMGNICEPRAPHPCGTHLTPPHPRSPALAQCRVSRARDGQGEGGALGEVLRGVGGVRGVAGAAGRERRRGPRSTALVGRGGAARQRAAKAAGATQGGGHRRIWRTRGQKMNAMY